MRLTASLLTAATFFLTIAPAAFADSFQFTINSSVTENIYNTSNDNYMGIYSTPPDGWGTEGGVRTAAPFPQNSPISNISFSVPAGNVITSAELDLILPSPFVAGVAEYVDYTTFGISPPDSSNPVHIAPTLDGGTVSASIDSILIDGGPRYGRKEGGSLIFDLSNFLTVDGGNGFSNLDDLRFLGLGEINVGVSGGYNWAGYIGGYGQANLPYEFEVTGTYSPVPEPSSIALLGTGLLALAGIARRKFLS